MINTNHGLQVGRILLPVSLATEMMVTSSSIDEGQLQMHQEYQAIAIRNQCRRLLVVHMVMKTKPNEFRRLQLSTAVASQLLRAMTSS